MPPQVNKIPFFSEMLIPFLIVFLLLAAFGITWLVRRHRRLERDDLVKRGLISSHRHHHHHHHHHHTEEKRNPTLAETGGLPPIRAQAAVKVPGIELNAHDD